jgi:hypothetical protein
MKNKYVSYPQILDFLTDLVDSETSGTLFIHSACNRAITFALENGNIHAVYFGARRGRKAIPLISNITGGSYRFEVSDLVEAFHDLPTTHEILHLLRNPHTINVPNHAGPTSTPTTIPAIDPTRGDGQITEEQKSFLCQELKGLLAEHMGPIAEMVFDDTVNDAGDFCATPESTQNFINILSEEIDNTNEVQQFRIKANEVLNKILNS